MSYAEGGGGDVYWRRLSSVSEHWAEGGSGKLEAGAPGETAASWQSPVSPQVLIRTICYDQIRYLFIDHTKRKFRIEMSISKYLFNYSVQYSFYSTLHVQ